jgi:polysaccharide export outer membrane protein
MKTQFMLAQIGKTAQKAALVLALFFLGCAAVQAQTPRSGGPTIPGSVSPMPGGMGPAPGAGPSPHSGPAPAAGPSGSFQGSSDKLGPGDQVRITVFRYPDLTTEVRLSENGSITFPMVGEVRLNGMSTEAAASRIAQRLKDGKFLNNPQVQVALLQLRSRQVSVLGDVARPGRYPLEDASTKITDVIAMAGGMGTLASDIVTVVSTRGGKQVKTDVNVPGIMTGRQGEKNIDLQNGDTVFVPRAPVFYIYGEVTRGGVYKLEERMTVMQAISLGGGLTVRGSERRLVVRRKGGDGKYGEYSGKLTDVVQSDDVIFVKESFF